MLPKYLDHFKSLQLQEKLKWIVIYGLMFIILILGFVVYNLSKDKIYRISIPPKLEFGQVIKTGEISKYEVYDFAGYIIQQLYYWRNGEIDFRKNIDKLNAFITPQYRDYLLREYKNLLHLGELKGRERSLEPIELFEASSVRKQKYGWLVGVDFHLQEHVNNKRFKSFNIRYFINIVRRDVNPETNPWGLMLDTPRQKPLRLKNKDK